MGKGGWMTLEEERRRYRYSFVGEGFLRMNIAGIRFVFYDQRKVRPPYSVRACGWRLGRFLIHAGRE